MFCDSHSRQKWEPKRTQSEKRRLARGGWPRLPLGRMSSSGSGGGPGFTFNHNDMTLEQAQAIWSLLRKGIMEIQNGNASTLRYEELYRSDSGVVVNRQLFMDRRRRNAYTLVLHKHGPLLYDGVAQTILDKLGIAHRTRLRIQNRLTVSLSREHCPNENRQCVRRPAASCPDRRVGEAQTDHDHDQGRAYVYGQDIL